MRRSMIIKLTLILSVFIFLLTACGSNDDPSGKDAGQTSSSQSLNRPPKEWEQNPDSDFDYSYNSELQGVEIFYKGESSRVWFPTTMNGDPVVSISIKQKNPFAKTEDEFDPEIIEEVYIPEGIRFIGAGAFSGCTNLKSIVIPDGVEKIGYAAFEDCYRLESVVLPDSVTTIGGDAFWRCSGLTSINMPKNLKVIESRAFGNCPLAQLILPEGLETIEDLAFMGSSQFNSLEIPGSVNYIEKGAFSNCSKLSTITLTDQDALMEIDGDAFEGTYWYEKQVEGFISLGSNLIGYKGNFNSTLLEIPEGIKSIGSSNSSMYNKIEKLILPEGLEYIGDYVFSDIELLEQIGIPSSLKHIGDGAFGGCTNLTNISLADPGSLRNIATNAFDGTQWYDNQPDGFVQLGSSILTHKGSPSLASIIVPGDVKAIGYIGKLQFGGQIFNSGDFDKVTKIILPEGIKVIGENAFSSCYSLQNINIPDSVTTIGDGAFISCENLDQATRDRIEEINPYTFDYRYWWN